MSIPLEKLEKKSDITKNLDKSAPNYNSSPLYRFLLSEGKFTGVEFFFKNIELEFLSAPGQYDIIFEYEIIGGNYKWRGYEESLEHLNRVVHENNCDQFKVAIGKILRNLLLLHDPRVILHKGKNKHAN